jgi:hypothetical protein
MDQHIGREVIEYELLREHLREKFPETDETTLLDTLEGLSSLPEMLGEVVRSQLDDQALVMALRDRISEMQARLARIENRAEKKRTFVASVMDRAGIKNLTEPDFTASLRQVPPGLVVVDERAVPDPFWRRLPPKLDRKGLLAALNAGQAVPGATLGNSSTTIAVRTR